MPTERRIAVAVASCLLLGTLAAAHARAADTAYFGGPDDSKLDLTNSNSARNSFLATLGSYGVEDLENLSDQLNPTLTFGSTSVTGATGFSNGVLSHFAYSVSGRNSLWDADGANDSIQFSRPVTAFGSYIVQGGDSSSSPPVSAPPNQLTLRLENSTLGTSKDIVIGELGPDWPFFNVIFVGITDTAPFDRVSFIETYDMDGLLYDDLIAGDLAATPGDFTQDGSVDGWDFLAWQRGESPNPLSPEDLSLWKANFGMPPISAVPEPNSLTLIAATALTCLRVRNTLRKRLLP